MSSGAAQLTQLRLHFGERDRVSGDGPLEAAKLCCAPGRACEAD